MSLSRKIRLWSALFGLGVTTLAYTSTQAPAFAVPTVHSGAPDEGCVDGSRSSPTGSYVMSVSMTGTSQGWAVGYSIGTDQTTTYIARWDGTAWTQVASPNPDQIGDLLCGVYAAGPGNAWAVGIRRVGQPGSGGIPQSLVLHWDGTTWSVVTIKGSPLASRMYAVTGTSRADVWVAGEVYHGDEGPPKINLEHWNGHRWRIIASPLPKSEQRGSLLAVDAFSPDGVAAVGALNWTHLQLSQAWDGTRWSRIACEFCDGLLNGVTMDSTSSAWAVGSTASGPLVERWDGSGWTQAQSPQSGGGALFGAKAVSASDAWTVGSASTGVRIEHWDGTAWSRVSAGSAPKGGTLVDVDAVSADDVWAVGYGPPASGAEPLFEHWNGSGWSTTR